MEDEDASSVQIVAGIALSITMKRKLTALLIIAETCLMCFTVNEQSTTSADRGTLRVMMMPIHDSSGISSRPNQGRPVNVKHDARCVMGKVEGEDKRPKQGGNFKNIT